MEILEFIKNNENWEEELSKDPYNISVKKEGDLVLLKYNQITSKKCDLTSSCRGVIIDTVNMEYVCRPFKRFFNYGEGYVPDIDWSSAVVREKVDGSLIKVYFYNGEWRVATNGTIDAFKASLSLPITIGDKTISTFGDLFIHVLMDEYYTTVETLLRDREESTHLFELCTPYNKVVVPHVFSMIYYLSSKKNDTGEETVDEVISYFVDNPRVFSLTSLEECISTASTMPFNEEGYVVSDKYLNRVKIKSPLYVHLHRLKSNGQIKDHDILKIIMENETAEYLNYFPEYRIRFEIIEKGLCVYKKKLSSILRESQVYLSNDRKKFSSFAKATSEPAFCFLLYDNKIASVEEYLNLLGERKIEMRLKYVEY